MVKLRVDPKRVADVRGKIDRVPFAAVVAHLKEFGGDFVGIVVAGNDLDLAELGAWASLRVGEEFDPAEEIQIGKEFAKMVKDGDVKFVFTQPTQRTEAGFYLADIPGNAAVEAFAAEPMFYIKFLGELWN